MNKVITLMMAIASITLYAQVGINTTSPDQSAALDVTSTSKGYFSQESVIYLLSPIQPQGLLFLMPTKNASAKM